MPPKYNPGLERVQKVRLTVLRKDMYIYKHHPRVYPVCCNLAACKSNVIVQ